VSGENASPVALWVYAVAIVLLAFGAVGIFNLESLPQARIGGNFIGEALMMIAPGSIAAGVLTFWVAHLLKSGVPGEDLRRLSKQFGRVSLFLIFVVPVVAAVGVSAAMKPEAGWIFIFLPAYVSFGAGVAVLIFSGVLSHLAKHD
jgi:hypothetical protein